MTLGAVLRRLAKRKKLGAYQIARKLGVYATTVYAWWKDEYAPNDDNLQAYAALMEVTVEDILKEAGNGQERKVIAERVYAVLARVAAGEDPVAAFIAVTGSPSLVTEQRRAALADAARQFKGTLTDLAGQDWDQAPEAVRRQVLQEMETELLAG